MASYGGTVSNDVGGVDTGIPSPTDYTNDADVPAILQDRALAIHNLIAGSSQAPTDAVFQALLDKFVVARSHRIELTGGKVSLLNTGTVYDMGLTVTAPAWSSVAILTAYTNIDDNGTSGDIKVTIKSNGAAIAYNEMYVGTQSPSDMHQFTTIQNVAANASLKVEVARHGMATSSKVGTRFLNVIFLRLSTQVAAALP